MAARDPTRVRLVKKWKRHIVDFNLRALGVRYVFEALKDALVAQMKG